MKTETIGLLSTPDSGKTLILDYFRKNYSDIVYESTNRGPGGLQIYEVIDGTAELTFDFYTIKELIRVHGCDVFPYPQIKNNISKDDLRAIHYSIAPSKDKTFVYSRCEDFKHYCDWGIFIGRDVRARWCVTQHREMGLAAYISSIHPHYLHYKYIKDSSEIHEINFEDLITNPKLYFDQINARRGMIYNNGFVPSTAKYNDWLTEMDLYNLYMYAQDGALISQDDLDTISIDLAEFNSYFGYPATLTKEEILGPTITEDIAAYMNSKFGENQWPPRMFVTNEVFSGTSHNSMTAVGNISVGTALHGTVSSSTSVTGDQPEDIVLSGTSINNMTAIGEFRQDGGLTGSILNNISIDVDLHKVVGTGYSGMITYGTSVDGQLKVWFSGTANLDTMVDGALSFILFGISSIDVSTDVSLLVIGVEEALIGSISIDSIANGETLETGVTEVLTGSTSSNTSIDGDLVVGFSENLYGTSSINASVDGDLLIGVGEVLSGSLLLNTSVDGILDSGISEDLSGSVPIESLADGDLTV